MENNEWNERKQRHKSEIVSPNFTTRHPTHNCRWTSGRSDGRTNNYAYATCATKRPKCKKMQLVMCMRRCVCVCMCGGVAVCAKHLKHAELTVARVHGIWVWNSMNFVSLVLGFFFPISHLEGICCTVYSPLRYVCFLCTLFACPRQMLVGDNCMHIS